MSYGLGLNWKFCKKLNLQDFRSIEPCIFWPINLAITRFQFKTRPKGRLRPRFYRGYRLGLGPRLKKCGLRLHGPIVARFRPRKKTRPNKPRPKAERALGRVFRSYGRVFKTRPQKHFFVVWDNIFILNSFTCTFNIYGDNLPYLKKDYGLWHFFFSFFLYGHL